MRIKIKRGEKLSPNDEFFVKILEFDNEFLRLVKKAIKDCDIQPPVKPGLITKEQEDKLLHWSSVIAKAYNLPVQWSAAIFNYLLRKELPNPGTGINYNIIRSFTRFEEFVPLEITVYEQVTRKELIEWINKNGRELDYHLRTLPHKRRSMDNVELVLEILTMRYKKNMRPIDIYNHYDELAKQGKISKVKSEMLAYRYISNIISRYKKALKGEAFYKKHHKSR